MSHAQQLNAGAYISPRNGGQLAATITAGAGQDGVQQTGPTIDRLNYGSATIAVATRTNISSTKNCTVALTLQHSDDGSTWVNAPADQQPGGLVGGGVFDTIVATGDQQNLSQYDVSLRPLKQYIRCLYTLDLSNTATDTAAGSVQVILGGPTSPPVL